MSSSNQFRDLLKAMKVPTPDAGAKEKALHRARIAFQNQESSQETQASTSTVLRWWREGLIVALALTIVLMQWYPKEEQISLSEHRKILKEMETLFQGQLTAVVEQGGETQVRLSSFSGESPMKSQRVMILLEKGASHVRIMSYSGQRTSVVLNGKTVYFEPLVTGSGKIMVMGDDFLWTSDNPQKIHSYKVQVVSLETSEL